MTDAERKLGEIALKKCRAQQILNETREQLKKAAAEVDLPVCIRNGDETVHVLPSQYPTGPPQVKIYRCVS